MIKLGVRGHDYGKSSPESLFQKIRGDGFESVQLALKKAIAGIDQFSDITPQTIADVQSACKKTGIHIAVLGVYIDPSLVDDALREKNVAEFTGSLPFAKSLNADCIGTETTQMSRQPGTARKDALSALYRSLWKIMPEAENRGVTVAIEPVASHTVNTPECAAEVLKTIASPNLKVIFDPVNVLTAEEAPRQDALWDRFFNLLGDKIAAVHIKGIRLDSQNQLVRSGFEDSIVHYETIFSALKSLPQNFSILREEIQPQHAKEDFRFLSGLLA
ncbi:MAG: sugar phosphate isomerase/epimerase [Oscillospiraceae bacterium]|jgi:sugar phosphate isomerase/epimerase|nr:sugar phosphate isomerase/epimerase [Oscillospiraceae bacterium]